MKFDTFHPAVEKGLPVTRVISRFILQKLLAEACEKIAGRELILNDCIVCDYEEKVSTSSCDVKATHSLIAGVTNSQYQEGAS